LNAIRIGQIGTRHGHAEGKWTSLVTNPDVEAVGIWEPDPEVRARAQARGRYGDARWCESASELLNDSSVVAIAIEGRNHESLPMALAAARSGKHLWYDKPAGDDWPTYLQLLEAIQQHGVYLQMGYMFRYSPGFRKVANLARGGALGDLFSVRAHMSTHVDLAERTEQTRHLGGILYDLGGHMLDQIVWLLGRPTEIVRVTRNDATPELPTYSDNTIAMLQFAHAIATVDIAAMEARPTARRFEVYGTQGSAILEGFDPSTSIRLALEGPTADYAAGLHHLQLLEFSRQAMYDQELEAFLGVIRDQAQPDRTLDHERLVQETLLRMTGRIVT
jgi:predicted dehydrogenase